MEARLSPALARPSKALLLFVALHFSILLMGVLRLDLPGHDAVWWQRLYARITGAGGSFGFFSPNVPRELGLSFDIEGPDGRITRAQLQDYASPEVQARVTNMVHLLATNFSDKKLMRALVASFTAAMFRENPDARSIRVHVDFYQFPTLAEYRAGKRTELKPVYSALFRRGASS